MNRRLALFVLLVMLLTACNGAQRDALIAGDDSLSRQELQSLLISLAGGVEPDTEIRTLPAELIRAVGTEVLRGAAIVDYFETEGGGIDDALWQSQRDTITNAETPVILPGLSPEPLQLGFLEFESPEFFALLNMLVANELVDARGEEIDGAALLEEFTEGFAVESRLGSWDDESFVIVAP